MTQEGQARSTATAAGSGGEFDREGSSFFQVIIKSVLMDYSAAAPWFSELGIEDEFFNDQCDIMDFFDENISAILEDDSQDSSSPKSNSPLATLIPRSSSTSTLSALSPPREPSPTLNLERPSKQHKSNNYNPSNFPSIPNPDQPSSSPTVITFGDPNVQEIVVNPQQAVTLGTLNPEDDAVSEVLTSHGSFTNLDEATKTVETTKTKKTGGRVRPPSQTYDHIIAERKRRQELSQRFVALSAMVPGLKKMDKSSVLGDAIKYLKHLQEKVKTLEEQAAKQTMESVVVVKRSQLVLLEDEGSSDEMSYGGSGSDEQPLPEIQAKLCHNTVLVRVHCEKQKGVVVKIISEVENSNLSVTHASVAAFGNLALDITIIAEMEKGFDVTIRKLLGSVRYALQKVKQAA